MPIIRNDKGQFIKGSDYWSGKKRVFSEELKAKIRLNSIGNKSRTGMKNSPESNEKRRAWSKKYGFQKGILHPLWKGDDIEYRALHKWVERNKGKATKCKNCGKIGNGSQIHWANIDHKYKRSLNDYISLCVSCHKKYDLNIK